jgi:hypothetical protein
VITCRVEGPDVNYRRLATAFGSGFPTFLIVAVAAVFGLWDRTGPRLRRVLYAYAAFGYVFFAV